MDFLPTSPSGKAPSRLLLSRCRCGAGFRCRTGPPPRRIVYGEAIPDQPSRTATSISIVHRVHRRPARANCVAVAASSVTNVAPARSPMARTIPDPTEYTFQAPQNGRRDPAQAGHPVNLIERHEVRQQQRHASVTTYRTDRHGGSSMARAIPDQPKTGAEQPNSTPGAVVWFAVAALHGSGMVLGIGDRGRYLRRVVGRGGPGRRRQRPGPSPITTGAGSNRTDAKTLLRAPKC